MRCIATPSTHNSGAGDADEAEGGGEGGGEEEEGEEATAGSREQE